MQTIKGQEQLAQSASALGSGILGFGIGAIWGDAMTSAIQIVALIIGAVIHITGMFILRIKNKDMAGSIAKTLWVTAWLCLLSLLAIFVYLAVK